MRNPFQRVIKNGNSLVVVLPADLVRGLGIQRGDLVQLHATSAQILSVRLFTPSEEENLRRKGFIENDTIIKH